MSVLFIAPISGAVVVYVSLSNWAAQLRNGCVSNYGGKCGC